MPSPDGTLPMVLVLIAGLGVFTLAMWWDRSDRVRQTRRSDVAFWIHLLAAPMIAHPIFHLLGVTDGGNIGSGAAVLVIGVYILFGLIALAIDRRALLVSAPAYVPFAMTQLFRTFCPVELHFRSAERRVGKEWVSTCNSRWSPDPSNKNNTH